MIFSDLLDDPDRTDKLFEALQHLKHNKHEVILFHVTDKKNEIDFELDNRPYTLVDMETGEKMRLQPAEIKEKYQNEIQAYFKEIEMRCIKDRIDFMPADILEGYEQVLLKYLIKRQKMG
jgi:DNA-binding sugar fermentation-stimulating protein